MSPAVLVAVLAGLGAFLAAPRPQRLGPLRSTAPRMVLPGMVASAGVGVGVLIYLNTSPVLIVVTVGSQIALIRTVRRRRAHRSADRRRGQVLTACEGLASDLAAGLPPSRALRAMAENWPELQPVADAADVGADVPTAFRVVAERPGADMLRVTAAAWSLAHRSGAGLAEALSLAAETLRSERATARIVATELASARATARLLALLPVGILVLGRGMGGDPVAFLLFSTTGQVCLTVGLGLAWAGAFWLERIADQVATP